MQLIILGMHRSGTSAVARLLNMMGAYFAPERMELPASKDNPKGYWERRDVVNLHEEVFADLEMNWYKTSHFDNELLTEAFHEKYSSRIREIILGLDAHRPWVLKDPRLCLLLPLWRPHLEFPVYIYVYRNPIQIAQSLQKRDGLPIQVGMALWEKYSLQAFSNMLDAPFLLVAYDELMQDPLNTVKKLYENLNDLSIQGLRLPAEQEILNFISPELFHVKGDSALQEKYINQQQQAWALQTRTMEKICPANMPTLSLGAQENLESYEQQQQLVEQIEVLKNTLSEQHHKYDELNAEYENISHQSRQTEEQLNEQVQQLHLEISQKQEKCAQQEAQLAQQQALSSQQQIELEQQRTELSQQHTELKQQQALYSQQQVQVSQQQTEFIAQQELIAKQQAQLAQQKIEYEQKKIEYEQKNIENEKHIQEISQQKANLQQAVQQSAQLQAAISSVQQQLKQAEEKLKQQEAAYEASQKALKQRQQQLAEQERWLVSLQGDSQALFNSMTWKSGSLLTRVALATMLRKPNATVEDHINGLHKKIAQTRKQRLLSSKSSNNLIASNSKRQVLSSTVQPKAKKPKPNQHDYSLWIKKYDTLDESRRQEIREHIESWSEAPCVSIIMPTYNTPESILCSAIDSVKNQLYPNWELCIADDASTKPHVRRLLEQYAAEDERIKICLRKTNGHISAASNSALALVTGELIGFLDHDDELAEHALFWVVYDVMKYPDAQLWYSDEDKINEKGERSSPYFKSEWNYDLLLSHNLVTHFAVYKTKLIKELGGLRVGYEGAQDYDLVLRVVDKISPAQIRHIPRVLYHWRMISGSTARDSDEKPYALHAAQKAIQAHLERRHVKATVVDAPGVSGMNRVKYTLPSRLPLVSLIIPTYNGFKVLRQCIDSILDKTSYENYEIIVVNNNSDEAETLAYLEEIDQHSQIRVLDYPHPFNYAAINNAAVEQARGELIGLLNNDLEVINADWLDEMVSHAVRPEIGVVGARLWYPNNTLQHAGVIVGIGGVAGHAHKGLRKGPIGYTGRAAVLQNYSAVTGACMLMRKANFELVGGLNAKHLTVALNDVDLCLKMNQHNLRVLWTPYAELYHHESATRGYEDTPEKKARYAKERAYLSQHWPQFMQADPAYSLNLTLDSEDFAFAWPPRVAPLEKLSDPLKSSMQVG